MRKLVLIFMVLAIAASAGAETKIIFAPFFANLTADARPIPDEAPVIRTIFSLKSIIQKIL